MKMLLTSVLMAVIPLGSAADHEHFACNLNAMSREERAVHQKVGRALFAAVQETRELDNGYAFRLPTARLVDVARWVALERKCCPFFVFKLELAKDDGPLTLRITGVDGVKPFMRGEFRL